MILKDIDGFVPSYKEANNSDDYNNGFADGVLFVMDELYHVPTVDAVTVVRCKYCCHSYDDIGGLTCSYGPCVDCIVPEDFYCKHGERKERMTVKAIKKSTLLEIARISREYARTGDVDILSARIEVAKKLATQAYGKDYAWLAFADFADSTCGVNALYHNCTDEDFCELFRAMKFEVLDE